ncbi:TolC family protein [Lunatibacter salilacus]|uniref:TolC family protein n=1 Tax=Lunatibacter salilacus TaxID=2483804 RepID=UPI00131BFF45|nr:TolC family protein [Lunatibacter salilacus]
MYKVLIIGYIILISLPALGQELDPSSASNLQTITLKETLKIGLKNNRDIKKALLDETAAKYQREEIRGSGLPQLKAYGNYNNFLQVFPQAVPSGLFGPSEPGGVDVIALGVPHSLQAGVQVNQLLFSSSYLIALKAAKTSEEFYKVLSSKTEEEVIYEIAVNYLGSIQLELQKENLLANIDQLQGLKTILEAQVANDMVRKIDLNRVRVNLSTLESELENLEIGIFQSLSYLKLLMGMPMGDDISLDVAQGETDMYFGSFQISALDIQDRTDIQLLDIQKTLLNQEFRNARAAKHPSLIAFGDINRNAFSTSFDFLNQGKVWYQGSLIGLKLEVPIFDGFVSKSKAAQSKVRSRQLEEDRRLAEDAASMEYSNASKKYFNSLKTLRATEDNLSLSNEILSETKMLYKENLSPLTDLLEAESVQRSAQANYNNQLIQVQLGQVEILKATGKIRNLLL